ncbi:MAG: uracil-DNA glycosylase [Firmicutes bacterium]|nr:uracil-DNA glycosylase [Bacillota bacterium]
MLTAFLSRLQQYKSGADTFNPWADYDPLYDCTAAAPGIRLAYLKEYLSLRIEKARYMLVAEAVGYQGAKFSGVPLTSERILLGYQSNIACGAILPQVKFTRTSRAAAAPFDAVRKRGFAEPTATIVWQLIQELELPPGEVIFWNIFPFHPFDQHKGRLSNRTPREGELRAGQELLNQLKSLCPENIMCIALGRKAGTTLGLSYPQVRHPANGGARLFREQLSKLVRETDRQIS